MNKRPLAPKFLNKLDNSLLINRPDTWSTRFHLVFYYALLFMLAFTTICFVVPMDARERSVFEIWSGCAGVLALIGLIIWLVYLFRFNVFKQFGTVFPGDRIKTFLVYFFIITMMILVVYIPPVVECVRAYNAYSSNELATDINRINELVTQLEQDEIPDDWNADTLVLIGGSGYTSNPSENYFYVDSSDMRWRLRSADSISKASPEMAIIYSFFDLVFIKEHQVRKHATVHIKSTIELYRSAYKKPLSNPETALNELQALVKKYATEDNAYQDLYYDGESQGLTIDIRNKYNLSQVNLSIDNICDRKYRLINNDYSDFIRATYYIALVMALLIFVFRHSTMKTFFLSLLVGIILSILSGLFISIFNMRETGILSLMLFYFFSFAIISMLIFKSKKRSIAFGIALNAFVMMTAFVPLIFVALYYASEKIDYYVQGMYSQEYITSRNQNFLLAEITGGIILLILIETLFKRLYRSWYASPED